MSIESQSPPVSPTSEKQPPNLDEDEVPDYQHEPISSFDEMGLDDLDETQARLEKLNNSELIAECVAFTPDCMEEI